MSEKKESTLAHIHEMFRDKIDEDVIKLVLTECQNDVEKTVTQLLNMCENRGRKASDDGLSSSRTFDSIDPVDTPLKDMQGSLTSVMKASNTDQLDIPTLLPSTKYTDSSFTAKPISLGNYPTLGAAQSMFPSYADTVEEKSSKSQNNSSTELKFENSSKLSDGFDENETYFSDDDIDVESIDSVGSINSKNKNERVIQNGAICENSKNAIGEKNFTNKSSQASPNDKRGNKGSNQQSFPNAKPFSANKPQQKQVNKAYGGRTYSPHPFAPPLVFPQDPSSYFANQARYFPGFVPGTFPHPFIQPHGFMPGQYHRPPPPGFAPPVPRHPDHFLPTAPMIRGNKAPKHSLPTGQCGPVNVITDGYRGPVPPTATASMGNGFRGPYHLAQANTHGHKRPNQLMPGTFTIGTEGPIPFDIKASNSAMSANTIKHDVRKPNHHVPNAFTHGDQGSKHVLPNTTSYVNSGPSHPLRDNTTHNNTTHNNKKTTHFTTNATTHGTEGPKHLVPNTTTHDNKGRNHAVPDINTHDNKGPNNAVPDINTTGTKGPKHLVPNTTTHDNKGPNNAVPDTTTRDNKGSNHPIPNINTPDTKGSKHLVPNTATHDNEGPNHAVPNINTPGTKGSKHLVPNTTTHDNKGPNNAVPDTTTRDNKGSNHPIPNINTPDTKGSKHLVPNTATHDNKGPNHAVPNINTPGTKGSKHLVPNTTTHDNKGPNHAVPDTTTRDNKGSNHPIPNISTTHGTKGSKHLVPNTATHDNKGLNHAVPDTTTRDNKGSNHPIPNINTPGTKGSKHPVPKTTTRAEGSMTNGTKGPNTTQDATITNGHKVPNQSIPHNTIHGNNKGPITSAGKTTSAAPETTMGHGNKGANHSSQTGRSNQKGSNNVQEGHDNSQTKMQATFPSEKKKRLTILRGLPGCGKSTLARQLNASGGGLIISTDDYFSKENKKYCFNPMELSEAHQWNQNRAKTFMQAGLTPVIIDNTNIQSWEMRPYVLTGLKCGYEVDIIEPETVWKWDLKELERRNTHGVPLKTIERMLERYEKNVTVETIAKTAANPIVVTKSKGGEEGGNTAKQKAATKQKRASNENKLINETKKSPPANAKLDHGKVRTRPCPVETKGRGTTKKAISLSANFSTSDSSKRFSGDNTSAKQGRDQDKKPKNYSSGLDGTGSAVDVGGKNELLLNAEATSKDEQISPVALVSSTDTAPTDEQSVPQVNIGTVNELNNVTKSECIDQTFPGERNSDLHKSSEVDTKHYPNEGDGSKSKSSIEVVQNCEKSSSDSKEIISSKEFIAKDTSDNVSCFEEEFSNEEKRNEIDRHDALQTFVDSEPLFSEEYTTLQPDFHVSLKGGVTDLPLDCKADLTRCISEGQVNESSNNKIENTNPVNSYKGTVSPVTNANSSLNDQQFSPENQTPGSAHSASVADSCTDLQFNVPDAMFNFLDDENTAKYDSSADVIIGADNSHSVLEKVDCETNSTQPNALSSVFDVLSETVNYPVCDSREPNQSYAIDPFVSANAPNTSVQTSPLGLVTNQNFDTHLNTKSNVPNAIGGSKSRRQDPGSDNQASNCTSNNHEIVEQDPIITSSTPGGSSSNSTVDLYSVPQPSNNDPNIDAQLHSNEFREPAADRIKTDFEDGNFDLQSPAPCTNPDQPVSIGDKNDSPDSIRFLNDCFPQMEIDLLKSFVNSCGGDLIKTVDSLLEYNKSHYLIEEDVASSYGSPMSPSSTPKKSQNVSVDYLQLTLDPALAMQLLEMFGAFSGVSAKDPLSESARSIRIDKDLAKILYTKWRKSTQARNKAKQTEESKKFSPGLTEGNAKRKYKTPPRQFYLPDPVQVHPPKSVAPRPEPVSLIEIMDEQLAIHVSQSDQVIEKKFVEEQLDLSTKLKRSRLHGMFPSVDPLALNEIFQANSYDFDTTVRQVQSSCGMPPVGVSPAVMEQSFTLQQSPGNRQSDFQSDAPASDFQTDVDGNFQSMDDPSYQDYRAEAQMHFELRSECIKKAALAYNKRQGELAKIYADQARQHGEKIKEANRRAAEMILESRNHDLTHSNTLDLHELHVKEAIQVLDNVLEERRNERRSPHKKSPSYLEVITGRGNRSRYGKPRIKPAVVEYLKRHGYRYEELNSGLYKVFLN